MRGNVRSSETQPQDAVLLLTLRHRYDNWRSPHAGLALRTARALKAAIALPTALMTFMSHVLLLSPSETFPDDADFRYGNAHRPRRQWQL